MKTDFLYRNDDSIITLLPQTDKAKKWTSENIPLELYQDEEQVCIELRFFSAISNTITSDGLTIERIADEEFPE